jgi:putative transposase
MVYAYLQENIGLKFQMSYNIPKQVAGTSETIIELVKIGMSYW